MGFTSHDSPENLITLLRTGEFEAVTLQYNVLDRVNEPVIVEAGRLGIGVVVMGPLHGGILGYDSPVLRRLMGASSGSTTADAAFRFVLSHPDVTCAISGMMTSAEILQNRRTVQAFKPFSLSERATVDAGLAQLELDSRTLCTGCRYCMPCPQGVGISEVFRLANASRIFRLTEGSRRDYALFSRQWPYDTWKDALCCTQCGACVPKCPRKIDIPAELHKAHELLK